MIVIFSVYMPHEGLAISARRPYFAGLFLLHFSFFLQLLLCRGDWKKDESTSACLLSANNLYDEDEDSRRLLAGYTTTSKGTRKIFFLKLEAKKKGPFHNNGEMKFLFCLEKIHKKIMARLHCQIECQCAQTRTMYFRFVDFWPVGMWKHQYVGF